MGTGGAGKAQAGADGLAASSCCRSNVSAQWGSCYSLHFFWRAQSQPQGTHGDTPQVLRCRQQPSNALSTEVGSQSCRALLGVSRFRSPDGFPLCPGPRHGAASCSCHFNHFCVPQPVPPIPNTEVPSAVPSLARVLSGTHGQSFRSVLDHRSKGRTLGTAEVS